MASTLSAKKRIRQNVKARSRNRWRKRTMRSAIKTFQDRVTHGSLDEARDAFHKVTSILDRTAAKGVIHKNVAARTKSRLNKRLKTMATAG